jgi:hypothetical protein
MARAALLVCVGTTFALAPKQAALADRYPITFSMEDEYSNETSLIPEGIWKALTRDSSVREVMSNELPRATEPPRFGVIASLSEAVRKRTSSFKAAIVSLEQT